MINKFREIYSVFIANILSKFEYVKELEAECKRLRLGDFTIESIHYTNGVLNASFKTQITTILAEFGYAMLKDYPTANNYIEIGIDHESEPFSCSILIQRHDGLSPHQLRLKAEQERDSFKHELENLKARLESYETAYLYE